MSHTSNPPFPRVWIPWGYTHTARTRPPAPPERLPTPASQANQCHRSAREEASPVPSLPRPPRTPPTCPSTRALFTANASPTRACPLPPASRSIPRTHPFRPRFTTTADPTPNRIPRAPKGISSSVVTHAPYPPGPGTWAHAPHISPEHKLLVCYETSFSPSPRAASRPPQQPHTHTYQARRRVGSRGTRLRRQRAARRELQPPTCPTWQLQRRDLPSISMRSRTASRLAASRVRQRVKCQGGHHRGSPHSNAPPPNDYFSPSHGVPPRRHPQAMAQGDTPKPKPWPYTQAVGLVHTYLPQPCMTLLTILVS